MKYLLILSLLPLSAAAEQCALVAADGTVENTIIADQEFVKNVPAPAGKSYICESKSRVHPPARGGTWNKEIRSFVPHKDFPSWRLDEEAAVWIAPKPMPAGKTKRDVEWDEAAGDWKDSKK